MNNSIEQNNSLQHLAPTAHSESLLSSLASDIHEGHHTSEGQLEDDEQESPISTKFINETETIKDDKKDELPEREKKGGRRKINIEFIENKSRRHVTFSKRKAGLIKKAYELSTLTGTQVLLLVASETGNVYTFATPKLQPLITKPEGKTLIQQCLNPPEVSEVPTPNQTPVHSAQSSQRLLSAQEPNLNPNSGMQEKKMSQQSQYGMRSDFQSRSPMEDRYSTKDTKQAMGSGLGGVADMSSVGGFASSLANNNPYATGPATLGLNSSQIPMYSYPMSMGGFVPPHSRPYVSDYSSAYGHSGYGTTNQYSNMGVSSLTQPGNSQVGQYPPSYLQAYASSQYQDPNSNKDSLV